MKKHKKEETSNNPFSEQDVEVAEANKAVDEEQIAQEEVVNDKKLKEDFENLNNQYIRLAADFDNYRKRQA